MEWPSGHKASSRCRASGKKKTNVARRLQPRNIGQNALSVLADYAGRRILRLHRSNVHSNMPPGFESCRLPSEGHLRSGENHEDGSTELLLETDGSGNQKKLEKLKRKLDSISQPLHTKTALQTASGSRSVCRRSSDVGDGRSALPKQKLGIDRGAKHPCGEEWHNKDMGVPPINYEHASSSASSDSSLQPNPSVIPYTCVQNPSNSSPSTPHSQPICFSDSHMRSGENHEDGLREPFLESGGLGNRNKPKRLKQKLDSITQPLHPKAALQVAQGSRPVTRRPCDVVDGQGALEKQKSGTDRGGKRPCREEGHGKGSGVAPMNSEHTTSSASADSSSQLFPSIFPYTCLQSLPPSTPSSPQSQPICSTPQPSISPTLPSSSHQPRDIPSDFDSSRSTSAACNRTLIFPDGSGFYPNPTEVVHCITSIIQSNFDGPWPTWKKIPINVRDQWFDEFQKRYSWQPEHARQMRLNFEARGMSRLRDFFCVARKNINVRPLWLSSEVWDGLKLYWESPEFKSKSEQAKINRASDCDGLGPSKHTCGSIPMSEHKRRLKEKTGEEVTPIKLFVHTHQRKDKTWVDSRSSRAYAKFMEEWNKLQSSQSAAQAEGQAEGQPSAQPKRRDSRCEGKTSAQPTQPAAQLSEVELWIKANLTKKGAIYGLGSEAVKYKHSNPSTSKFRSSEERTPLWFDTPEFQEFLSKKVTEISSEWNARLEEERRDTEELRKRVAQLEKEKQEKKSKKAAKKKLKQMKEMMKLLQMSYESLSKGQPSDDDDESSDDSSDSDN